MPKDGYRVAVVGATGAVGQHMLGILAERSFPVSEIVVFGSARSAGRRLSWAGRELAVAPLEPAVFAGVELALFSAGSSVSREWGPVAAGQGALAVDNSSAWRMDPEVPLCVPEVNLEAARSRPKGIVANPNCSTIQMVLVLKPLHDVARIRRVVVSTYQAISGAGSQALEALRDQQRGLTAGEGLETERLAGRLAGNLLMHWKVDRSTGYQEEELKMLHETRKILDDSEIRVSPTTVRVPVEVGHSESVAVETERPITPEQARKLLSDAAGVEVVDDFAQGVYPQPIDVAGKDPVLVGRIREDLGNPGGLQMWIVGDNLRKGAALNAIQIAEQLLL